MENKDKHGLAINIKKFQCFNFEFFNCQEIVLYETLMVLGGKSFAKREEFYHSTESLVNKTGIKKHTVNETMIRFKQLGILDYQIKGMPQVKHIRILWSNILQMLPEIYQFDKVEEYFDGSIQTLIDFYQQLAENNEKIAENTEEKNNIKNSKEENKKEFNYKVDVEENFKIMLANERYVKMTMEKFHLTRERFIELYKLFNQHLVVRNDVKKTPKEYCGHFYSWYIKKYRINENSGKPKPLYKNSL